MKVNAMFTMRYTAPSAPPARTTENDVSESVAARAIAAKPKILSADVLVMSLPCLRPQGSSLR